MALGMAFGVFSGMMPILPFQTAVAVALALFFRGSKLTAAVGTWISNPLNWYFIYYWSHKIGAFVLGLSEKNAIFSSIMKGVQSGEDPMVIVGRMLSSGSTRIAAFLIGGLVMGLTAAVPTYFIFLPIFKRVKNWREMRRRRKNK